MWKHEGMAGFFKGNGINIIRIVPFTAFEFFFYETFKVLLFPYVQQKDMTLKQKLMSGALTGITASSLTYPLEVIKTQITVDTKHSHVSMYGMAKRIVQNEGVLGLYHGWGVSMFGIIPFTGIKMASFDWMMLNWGPEERVGASHVYTSVFFGALAGFLSVSVAYPFDVIRKLLQLNHSSKYHNYKNVYDCVQQVYARDGIHGFYRGQNAAFMKILPMTAILFLCNE